MMYWMWGNNGGDIGLFGVLMSVFMIVFSLLVLALLALAVVWLAKEIQRKK